MYHVPFAICPFSVPRGSGLGYTEGMKIIGHRGAKGLAPENTLVSFRAALQHRVDGLEFDLRVTRDGVVVLSHDPAISDQAGGKLLLKEHDYRKLRQYKADLLSFEQFINEIGRPVHLVIEIKPREPTAPIIIMLQDCLLAGWQPADFSIASFDQSILRIMHKAFPEVELIVNEKWSGVRGRWRADQLGTKRLSMRSWWLWRGFLKVMWRRGYRITPYTVNSPARARKWRPYVYGIVTDYPDRFNKKQ